MKTLLKKMGIMLCALAIAVSCLPASAFAAEMEPAILEEEKQQAIALDQLEYRTTEDGNIQYDVTAVASITKTYLGAFTFTDVNTGKARAITGDEVRFIIEFKKADTQPTDIDLKVELARVFIGEDGNEYMVYRGGERFLSRNCDEITSDGYYHVETEWFNISSESGKQFCLLYDAMTEFGETGTGAFRSASVRVWMEVD